MSLPTDYPERVYAGVLGKIIGVYLGRPFEGWTYERIMRELGPIHYYVHEQRGVPLIVTDDDISGTFTFLRALADYGYSHDLSPAQVGQTWLNYLIEQRTILWWGGLGLSTEHTAYLRLKAGTPAPASGSAALNSTVVAEQIGAQIFIDGWAMVAPGDPELVADLARRAASVSHDGEAVYGAQALAAMESLAFVERDTERLLDGALRAIPPDSIIARLHSDLREWHARDGDWQTTRERIVNHYGYHIYGGNCHIVPNHALILLGLLYGADDFQTALMITNTAGWDTDCNSGNLGCLLGIKNGLAGLDAGPDWRGPVADRLFLPTADGGRAITDAVIETYHIVNAGRALKHAPPLTPKDGARFHFELPGSVQGFRGDDSVATRGTLELENVAGHSRQGQRSLRLRYRGLAPGRVARVSTATFVPPDAIELTETAHYGLLASPTLYPGETVRAGVAADSANQAPITVQLYSGSYGAQNALDRNYGAPSVLEPGESCVLDLSIGDSDGAPIAEVGLELRGTGGVHGAVYLDFLTWDGTPRVTFKSPAAGGTLWQRAWVNGVDQLSFNRDSTYRLVQNNGTGLLIQGTREWTDYSVAAPVRPHLAVRAGIAARVQGMRRWYGLLLYADGYVRLVKALDGEQVLAETGCEWQLDRTYALALDVRGAVLRATVDDVEVLQVRDTDRPLTGGAIALVTSEGRVDYGDVTVRA